ncbi:peptide deformylase [Rhizobiales bacterium GAS113]|jgi:peptide deformylase|nr:peptide deformylase [Rhizobiales bacterium GAS113]SEC87250.1 peptide deformylase [Rhizobiales bacterium GAS188]
MSIRPILLIPDPRLKRVCAPVETVTDEVRKLASDMLETMYDAPGIGLAASQIGELIRLVVIDVAKKDEERQPLTLINPEIVWASPERSIYEEGCLSIPEFYEEVERSAMVTVRFLDAQGAECEMTADGLLGTCLQHEIDHLNGVLFIDHISKLKRDRVVRKFKKDAKRKAEEKADEESTRAVLA